MTVRELIEELEDMPQDAEVILDHNTTVVNKTGTSLIKSDYSGCQYVGIDVEFDYDEVTIRGEWLDEMENPPEEFVVLQ